MNALKFIGGYLVAGAVVGTAAHVTTAIIGYKAGAKSAKKAEKKAK